MTELGIIALMLFCTAIVGTLAQRFQIPAVIGQIVVGIILGPALLNIVHPNEILSFLAEIGVIILMFMAGLESDLQLLKRYLRPSLSVAVCGGRQGGQSHYGTCRFLGNYICCNIGFNYC